MTFISAHPRSTQPEENLFGFLWQFRSCTVNYNSNRRHATTYSTHLGGP